MHGSISRSKLSTNSYFATRKVMTWRTRLYFPPPGAIILNSKNPKAITVTTNLNQISMPRS